MEGFTKTETSYFNRMTTLSQKITSLGILNPAKLSKMRKISYFALIVVSVVITPPDFISDVLVIVPLLVLYELSISLSAFIYRKKTAAQGLFIFFILGIVFGYFVLFPLVLQFLIGLSAGHFQTMFTAEHYFRFMMNLTLPFGFLFEMPLIVMFCIYDWLIRDLDEKLAVLGPGDILWVYMMIAGVLAIAATIPVAAFQTWRFVAPALTDHERRTALFYILRHDDQ
ncbi:hypothetical protein DT075_36690 [Bacillus licheniformis]|nr:hypothetical protein DT075_36690 [Bacillus licheniformis]